MNSHSKSKRALIPFVPDLPYHVQIVFILSMSFIWHQAFVHDYESELPTDPVEEQKIHVSSFVIVTIINL